MIKYDTQQSKTCEVYIRQRGLASRNIFVFISIGPNEVESHWQNGFNISVKIRSTISKEIKGKLHIPPPFNFQTGVNTTKLSWLTNLFKLSQQEMIVGFVPNLLKIGRKLVVTLEHNTFSTKKYNKEFKNR